MREHLGRRETSWCRRNVDVFSRLDIFSGYRVNGALDAGGNVPTALRAEMVR